MKEIVTNMAVTIMFHRQDVRATIKPPMSGAMAAPSNAQKAYRDVYRFAILRETKSEIEAGWLFRALEPLMPAKNLNKARAAKFGAKAAPQDQAVKEAKVTMYTFRLPNTSEEGPAESHSKVQLGIPIL